MVLLTYKTLLEVYTFETLISIGLPGTNHKLF